MAANRNHSRAVFLRQLPHILHKPLQIPIVVRSSGKRHHHIDLILSIPFIDVSFVPGRSHFRTYPQVNPLPKPPELRLNIPPRQMRRRKIARQFPASFLRLTQLMPPFLYLPRRIRNLVGLVRHQQRAVCEVVRKPAVIEEPRVKPLFLNILPFHQ